MGNAHAVVVAPPSYYTFLNGARTMRWLSRGRVKTSADFLEPLQEVLKTFGMSPPTEGLAALRSWGQTSERPAGWVAAADPVHFETRLRHLVVRALEVSDVSADDLEALFGDLQTQLGDSDTCFVPIDQYGYLHAMQPVATASVSAAVADGRVPDELTPAGDAAATYHGLLGEVQMLLHDHNVNSERAGNGLPAINALWFWGGGVAPEVAERPLPALFGDDPLFCGYWHSCSATVGAWPGNIHECIDASDNGFVAVIPESGDSEPGRQLNELRRHLLQGRFSRLTIIVRRRLVIDVCRRDLIKLWRGISPLLREPDTNE